MKDWPIEIDPDFGCWCWTGMRDERDGRALVWRGTHPVAAYRVVYAEEVGPVPEGLVLDHACRRPFCVNPLHLEPVTKTENERRKRLRYRVRMVLCPRGHDLTTAMVTAEGGRLCRTCHREQQGGG